MTYFAFIVNIVMVETVFLSCILCSVLITGNNETCRFMAVVVDHRCIGDCDIITSNPNFFLVMLDIVLLSCCQ